MKIAEFTDEFIFTGNVRMDTIILAGLAWTFDDVIRLSEVILK